MGLMYRIKELKNFRKTGKPSEGKSAEWKSPFDTLRKKWDTVPTTASESAKTANLSQRVLSLRIAGGITRYMRAECAAKR